MLLTKPKESTVMMSSGTFVAACLFWIIVIAILLGGLFIQLVPLLSVLAMMKGN